MQIHVVLRIICKVALVTVHGHGINGKPTVPGFSDMCQKRLSTVLHKIEYRFEERIIQKNKVPQTVPESHPDIFPDLEA